MDNNEKVVLVNTAFNLKKIDRVLNYIDNHPSKQGEKAKKSYKKYLTTIIITIIVIAVISGFFIIKSIKKNQEKLSYLPEGATTRIVGHVSLYDDTFWYTKDSQKYEYKLNEYNVNKEKAKEKGIIIYLDDNNEAVSVDYDDKDVSVLQELKPLILGLVFIILGTIIYIHITRATIGKDFYLYSEWYSKEIDVYRFQPNFEEITANKEYHDMSFSPKKLDDKLKRKYKMAWIKNIIFILLAFLGPLIFVLIIFNYDIHINKWIFWVCMIIYIIFFYILCDNCEVNMHRIKNQYIKEQQKKDSSK